MKKLFSYLITLIVGLIGGIYCHDKVRDTAIDWLDKRAEKRKPRTLYSNFKYEARPWVYYDASYDYEDIRFAEREDADKVLFHMQKETDKNVVTIADFKRFSGLAANWSDTRYGWTDLSEAKVFRSRNGKYYLDLPEPISIDNLEDTNVSI